MYIAYAPCGMQTHHTLNVSFDSPDKTFKGFYYLRQLT